MRFPFSVVALLVPIVVHAAPGLAHPGMHEREQAAKRALAEHPADPEAHLKRGELHAERGQWDKALSHFERGRVLGASVDRVALLQGALFLAAGWPRMARLRYDEVLLRQPKAVRALAGRARALMQLGFPGLAERDFSVAFSELGRVPPALVLERRDALVAAGRRDVALRVLDEQIERSGPVPALQSAAIDLEVSAQRYDAALQRVEKIMIRSPRNPIFAARRAEILASAGREQEAVAAYREALSMVRARVARRPSKRLQELEARLRSELERRTLTQQSKGVDDE